MESNFPCLPGFKPTQREKKKWFEEFQTKFYTLPEE